MLLPIASALLFLLAAPRVSSSDDRGCGKCEEAKCAPPGEECLSGRAKDLCGCCYVCGRGEGELCDSDDLPPPYRGRGGHGPCGENLVCLPRTDQAPGDLPEAQCVCAVNETLCGSDGRTYDNECQLTRARYERRDGLRALHRGPCNSAPKIVTPPEDVSNYTGGHVAMSCEATGWPIPVFEWRVDRGDGDAVPLPSDDPEVAVQSRGGPSKYEVTTWLQMHRIQPKHDATYWCIAKNQEGEASAAARIVILDYPNEYLENKESNEL